MRWNVQKWAQNEEFPLISWGVGNKGEFLVTIPLIYSRKGTDILYFVIDSNSSDLFWWSLANISLTWTMQWILVMPEICFQMFCKHFCPVTAPRSSLLVSDDHLPLLWQSLFTTQIETSTEDLRNSRWSWVIQLILHQIFCTGQSIWCICMIFLSIVDTIPVE